MSESKEGVSPELKKVAESLPMDPRSKLLAGPNAGNGKIEKMPKRGLVDPRGQKVSSTPEAEPTKVDPTKSVTLVPHEDGHVFKFTDVPLKPGRYALFDGTGATFGVVNHPSIAQMICTALKLVADAQRVNDEPAAESGAQVG